MNQSDLKSLRARLQARQAQDSETELLWEILGAATFALFILVIAFI